MHREKLIHISEAERGKSCDCICPSCNSSLIAKKGEKLAHHFAHSIENCEYGYETSLHLAAKEILQESKEIIIPPVVLKFSSYIENIFLASEKRVPIDRVELEKRFESVVPDVVVYSGGKPLYIEICVTHKVDAEKKKKITEQGISTVEIDLSTRELLRSNDDFKEILLNEVENKTWIYNSYANRKRAELFPSAKRKNVIERGLAFHADYCPKNQRIWNGKSYANVLSDCIYCENCIDYVKEQNYYYEYIQHYVVCTG